MGAEPTSVIAEAWRSVTAADPSTRGYVARIVATLTDDQLHEVDMAAQRLVNAVGQERHDRWLAAGGHRDDSSTHPGPHPPRGRRPSAQSQHPPQYRRPTVGDIIARKSQP